MNLCQRVSPNFCLRSNTDVHTVASLLKLYLRELPEPVIPYAKYEDFLSCATLLSKEEEAVSPSCFCINVCSGCWWHFCLQFESFLPHPTPTPILELFYLVLCDDITSRSPCVAKHPVWPFLIKRIQMDRWDHCPYDPLVADGSAALGLLVQERADPCFLVLCC